jgi:hypothetical protein
MPNVLALKQVANQIKRFIFVREMVLNNQKIVFFLLFWGIWAPPNGPKEVFKGPLVGTWATRPTSRLVIHVGWQWGLEI